MQCGSSSRRGSNISRRKWCLSFLLFLQHESNTCLLFQSLDVSGGFEEKHLFIFKLFSELLRALICVGHLNQMQPVSISWTCKFTRESPKDQSFCGGFMLFITIDRLEQASGKIFCQYFSTPALVLAQNDNRSGSDCSYILAQFFEEISWCSYLLFFALCVSVLWHCRPISSSFGRGLEVLKVQRHCKHIAASRPQQRLSWKPALGSCVLGAAGLQRWWFTSLLLHHHLIVQWVLETADSLRTKWRFHADCDGQTENERKCVCCLQEPVLCGLMFPNSLLGSAGWSLQASVGNPWLCWRRCLKFCQRCLRLLELCPLLCSPETEWVQANEWMDWPTECCIKHSFSLCLSWNILSPS